MSHTQSNDEVNKKKCTSVQVVREMTMLKMSENEAYEINNKDASLGLRGVMVQVSGYPGYPMVALANLLLRNSCVSLILPSSSGIPALMSESPRDKRFGNVDDWRSIVSPVLSCGMLEADRDLGRVAAAIMGGLSIGERNGTEPWIIFPTSVMPDGFIRGGGTWVFLGSTSI